MTGASLMFYSLPAICLYGQPLIISMHDNRSMSLENANTVRITPYANSQMRKQ
jgi:hypothetical protein